MFNKSYFMEKKYIKFIVIIIIFALVILEISLHIIKNSNHDNNENLNNNNNNDNNKKEQNDFLSISNDVISLNSSKIDKLSNYLKKHNNVDDITGLKIENNKFILELNDTLSNDITFVTKYLLIYDIDKDEVKEIKYNGNNRIWDVAIFNGKIYYSCINYDSKTDKTYFKIIESDLNLKNEKTLEHGQVSNAVFSPKLISSSNTLFYTLVDDYTDSNSSYSKFEIKMLDSNSNISKIASGFFDYGNQTGTTFTSMNMFKYYKNNLYYETYNNGVAKINAYNIQEKTTNSIYSYEIKEDDFVINDFYDSENYKFYTYLMQNQNDIGGASYYNDEKKIEVPISEYKNITRLDDNLYFISSMNKIYLLDTEDNKLNKVSINPFLNRFYEPSNSGIIGVDYNTDDFYLIEIKK